MLTEDGIVAAYKALSRGDIFGFSAEVLLPYLSFEKARPFLNEDADAEKWGEALPLTRENVLKEMQTYMEFAWGKVEDHRGISASRSIEKFRAWLTILEETDGIDWNVYAQYGAPILKAISVRYGFPIPDNDRVKRMMAGEPCEADCCQGCG